MSVLRRERSAHTGRAHVGHVCADGGRAYKSTGECGCLLQPLRTHLRTGSLRRWLKELRCERERRDQRRESIATDSSDEPVNLLTRPHTSVCDVHNVCVLYIPNSPTSHSRAQSNVLSVFSRCSSTAYSSTHPK
jgi:hypothetical protein